MHGFIPAMGHDLPWINWKIYLTRDWISRVILTKIILRLIILQYSGLDPELQ